MPTKEGKSPWGHVTMFLDGEITRDPSRWVKLERGGFLVEYGHVALEEHPVTSGDKQIGVVFRDVGGGYPDGPVLPPAVIEE